MAPVKYENPLRSELGVRNPGFHLKILIQEAWGGAQGSDFSASSQGDSLAEESLDHILRHIFPEHHSGMMTNPSKKVIFL